ncbi:hypothetical protein GUJ93_ZPchr0006g43485 [Zizania palustris]|uniref:Uncharacterized protein n=1 Tax=Zizania palustris TaxID=103762 RepID=A0A8J5SXU9_ZIZPA|nr:hypothetical protein GUJ93_ZPchr0006g43485 [Zizania palustris]
MKSGDGLDCISFTSCRIRFTIGFPRLYFPPPWSSYPSPRTPPPPREEGDGEEEGSGRRRRRARGGRGDLGEKTRGAGRGKKSAV